MNVTLRRLPRLLAALTLAALASCSPPDLQDTAPLSDIAEAPPAYAPPSAPQEPSSQTALLGGPPESSPPPPAYVPPPAPEFVPFKMAPIPNPPEPEPAPARRVERSSRTIAPSNARISAPKRQAPAPTANQAAALGAALTAEVSAGSRLSVPDGLTSGREGIVVLTLPDTLTSRLQAEAAKLGLADGAKTATVHATLTGQGYEITPNGAQSLPLGDTPAKFSWKVLETADTSAEKLPLRAEVTGQLKNGRTVRTFPLATLGALPAAPVADRASQGPSALKGGDKLALVIPLVLILIALFILGRWARMRQTDKDRRRATLAESHS